MAEGKIDRITEAQEADFVEEEEEAMEIKSCANFVIKEGTLPPSAGTGLIVISWETHQISNQMP